jgi:hypothetical protein
MDSTVRADSLKGSRYSLKLVQGLLPFCYLVYWYGSPCCEENKFGRTERIDQFCFASVLTHFRCVNAFRNSPTRRQTETLACLRQKRRMVKRILGCPNRSQVCVYRRGMGIDFLIS